MSIRNLPALNFSADMRGLGCDAPPDAIDRWNAGIAAADGESDNTISVLEVIGEDFWTGGGVTAKRVAGALRSIGKRDVVVNINSPGGDFFEGVAIYSLLREHQAKVTVRILGLAASAASIIAMAGDQIEISRPAFLMIHNVWVIAMGNRHDLRDAADQIEPFDRALADVYSARTGKSAKDIAAMLDKETWIGGQDAVDQGFADALLSEDQVRRSTKNRSDTAPVLAAHRADALLARCGLSRSDRRSLIRDIKTGTPSAAASATHDAGDLAFAAEVQRAIATLSR